MGKLFGQSIEVSEKSLLAVRHLRAVESVANWKTEAPSRGGCAPTTRNVGPASSRQFHSLPEARNPLVEYEHCQI